MDRGDRFPFSIATATASAELLDRLQWVHNVQFTLDVPLALPTSFLVDAHAAAGQWDQAILHAERAGQLALDAGNLSAARDIKARRNLYSQRNAYVEE